MGRYQGSAHLEELFKHLEKNLMKPSPRINLGSRALSPIEPGDFVEIFLIYPYSVLW